MPPFVARIATLFVMGLAAVPVQPDGNQAPRGLGRPWHLVNGRNWQIEAESVEPVGETDAREGTRGACSEGMVAVVGDMKRDGIDSVEWLQDSTCTHWVDRHVPERCAHFDRAAWHETSQTLKMIAMRFCIDRFEYPNRRNDFPVIDVSWRESVALCAAEGKRLCSEDEWTFACEGEEATPYPTGYTRGANECVIDRPWRKVDERALLPRDSRAAIVEIDRLWQGERSGSHATCRSQFGVYDMTGNVDEWTSSVDSQERPSIMKGGYWGPVRARCRSSTRAHEPNFSFYQQGLRCCRDLDW